MLFSKLFDTEPSNKVQKSGFTSKSLLFILELWFLLVNQKNTLSKFNLKPEWEVLFPNWLTTWYMLFKTLGLKKIILLSPPCNEIVISLLMPHHCCLVIYILYFIIPSLLKYIYICDYLSLVGLALWTTLGVNSASPVGNYLYFEL